MEDVFNFSKELSELKAEVKSLKNDSKYLKKKAEITPLIALYNHVRGQNRKGEYIVFSITIFTKAKDRYSYKFEKIIALNDSIHEYQNDELNKVCDISDITTVELVSTIDGVRKAFEYKFDK